MFLYLPDPAPLAVRCLAPGVSGSRAGHRRDDDSARFSDDHDPLIRTAESCTVPSLHPPIKEATMKIKTHIQAGANPWYESP